MTGSIRNMTDADNPRCCRRIEPTIAASFAGALLDLVVSKGGDRDELLRRSGIAGADLLDRNERIPLGKWLALMRLGKEASGDPALALHFGRAFDMAELSVIGLLGPAAATKADGFRMLGRFWRLVADLEAESEDRFELRESEQGTWLVDTRLDPNETPEISEAGFAQIATMAQRMMPGERHFLAAHFTHEAPAHRAEYEAVLGIPVTFSSDRNALLMPKGWAKQPIALQPPHASEIFSAHAESLLGRLEERDTLLKRVEAILEEMLPQGPPRAPRVARRLGIAPHSLYRGLKAEGASFAVALEKVRRRLALRYVRAGIPAKEAAWRLGYADPATFSRAFKRWTGSGPRRYRRSAPH